MIIDELSDLPNKGAITNSCSQKLEHLLSSGEKEKFSIILFDVDYFKAINDLFGHEQGDQVIREIGQVLQSVDSLAYCGLVGRYGGEEFLIALPYGSESEAFALAETIRETIRDRNFMKNNSREPFSEQITVSLGVETIDLDEAVKKYSIEELRNKVIMRADRALSYAKFLGKNRVEVFHSFVAKELKKVDTLRDLYFKLAHSPRSKRFLTLNQGYFLTDRTFRSKVARHWAFASHELNPRDTRTLAVLADSAYKVAQDTEELYDSLTSLSSQSHPRNP